MSVKVLSGPGQLSALMEVLLMPLHYGTIASSSCIIDDRSTRKLLRFFREI